MKRFFLLLLIILTSETIKAQTADVDSLMKKVNKLLEKIEQTKSDVKIQKATFSNKTTTITSTSTYLKYSKSESIEYLKNGDKREEILVKSKILGDVMKIVKTNDKLTYLIFYEFSESFGGAEVRSSEELIDGTNYKLTIF